VYNAGPQVTVDERIVPFREHCPFRQFMPNTPARYSTNFGAPCDEKSIYAWNMQVYTGSRARGAPEKNQGLHVVLDTMKGNMPELPNELLKLQSIAVNYSKLAFSESTTFMSYCPKTNKNVCVLSTTRQDKKPKIILDYNFTKGRGDSLDKVTEMYSPLASGD
uniref:PiggyBac transposable element-derived protein domain-containing protein n=1 Tax=Lepisosteus oculatus TaxID=7918 RepID=W5MYG4_LEPOC